MQSAEIRAEIAVPPARTGRRPSPARCRDQSREERRAISVQL